MFKVLPLLLRHRPVGRTVERKKRKLNAGEGPELFCLYFKLNEVEGPKLFCHCFCLFFFFFFCLFMEYESVVFESGYISISCPSLVQIYH
jgi:hypothetical protein